MKRKSSLVKILFAVLAVASVAYFIFVKGFFNHDSSYPLIYGNIDISIEANGFIVRDENIITTNSSGQVQYFIAEGEKIKKNQLVAQIQTNNIDTQNIDDEDSKVLPTQNISINIEDINYDIEFIFFKIKEEIENARYSQIYDLKEELKLKLDKKIR
ncbi:MAG: hypothetical protein J7L15_03740, partial [Clostridiales bacterium]|nr:hypothetical protein [Clostridiales bacterium]